MKINWLTFMYYFICEGAYFVSYSELNRDLMYIEISRDVTLQNRGEWVTSLAKQF